MFHLINVVKYLRKYTADQIYENKGKNLRNNKVQQQQAMMALQEMAVLTRFLKNRTLFYHRFFYLRF